MLIFERDAGQITKDIKLMLEFSCTSRPIKHHITNLLLNFFTILLDNLIGQGLAKLRVLGYFQKEQRLTRGI